MPGRISSRTAAQRARQLLTTSKHGGIIRDDSDDEIEDDDIPWEWLYPSPTSNPLSPIPINQQKGQPPAKKQKREVVSSLDSNPIGAKCGTFECQIGDCLLLKADGQKSAWVGLAVAFDVREDEKEVLIMWFSAQSEIRNKDRKRKDFLLVLFLLSA